jgi:hypothetical protein
MLGTVGLLFVMCVYLANIGNASEAAVATLATSPSPNYVGRFAITALYWAPVVRNHKSAAAVRAALVVDLTNALNGSSANGTVSVLAAADDGTVAVRVSWPINSSLHAADAVHRRLQVLMGNTSWLMDTDRVYTAASGQPATLELGSVVERVAVLQLDVDCVLADIGPWAAAWDATSISWALVAADVAALLESERTVPAVPDTVDVLRVDDMDAGVNSRLRVRVTLRIEGTDPIASRTALVAAGAILLTTASSELARGTATWGTVALVTAGGEVAIPRATWPSVPACGAGCIAFAVGMPAVGLVAVATVVASVRAFILATRSVAS